MTWRSLSSSLEKNDALKKAIVVVTNSFESLILTYLSALRRCRAR